MGGFNTQIPLEESALSRLSPAEKVGAKLLIPESDGERLIREGMRPRWPAQHDHGHACSAT